MSLEDKMIILARHRLKAVKVLSASHAGLDKVQNSFYELTGLTSIRFVQDCGLSESAANELTLIDNLAILTIRSVYPEAIEIMPAHARKLAEYLDMPERQLVDLIFKSGGRFNNTEAVSVALHRGIITNKNNEAEAYQRLSDREHRQNKFN